MHFMFDVGLLPILTITFFILVAWLITKPHKPAALATDFRSPRTEAVTAIGVVIAIFVAIALFFSLFQRSIAQIMGASGEIGVAALVFGWTFYASFFFVPLFAVLRVKHQRLGSIGITGKNLKFSLITGAALSALWLAIGFSVSPHSLAQVFTASSFYSLFYYTAIGFGEELLFRGYLQHRCSAWLGATEGLIVSSIIMAFAHVPQRIFVVGLSPTEAVMGSAFLTPLSIFLGLIFLRTQNVIGPSVFHTILDFANTL